MPRRCRSTDARASPRSGRKVPAPLSPPKNVRRSSRFADSSVKTVKTATSAPSRRSLRSNQADNQAAARQTNAFQQPLTSPGQIMLRRCRTAYARTSQRSGRKVPALDIGVGDGWLGRMRLQACMKLHSDHHIWPIRLAMSVRLSHPLPKLRKQTTPNVTGWQGRRVMTREAYLELIPPWHSCQEGMMRFLLLALDSKAGTGLAISINSKAEYTTTNNIAGVALDLNSTDRRLDGLRLVSWPLLE